MQCQHCNKNEAERTFIVNMMGTQFEVHLCDECLQQIWQYAGATGQRQAFTAFTGWWPGKADAREGGGNPFPADAGTELKQRRRLSALQARLHEAARTERYEEAARLRDELAAESGEHAHEL